MNYKGKISRGTAEGLRDHINYVVTGITNSDSDDDKMLASVLAQVYVKLEEKLVRLKPKYSITLTPAEAFAMRVLSQDFVSASPFINNNMLMLSNDIHQFFTQ